MLVAGRDDDLGVAGERARLGVDRRGLEVQIARLALEAHAVADALGVVDDFADVPVAGGGVGVDAAVEVADAFEERLVGRAFEEDEFEALGPLPRLGPQSIDFGVVDVVEVDHAQAHGHRARVAAPFEEGGAGVEERRSFGDGAAHEGGEVGAAELGGAGLDVAEQGRSDAPAAGAGADADVELEVVGVVQDRQSHWGEADHAAVLDGDPLLLGPVARVLDELEHEFGRRGRRQRDAVVREDLEGGVDLGLHQLVVGVVEADDREVAHPTSVSGPSDKTQGGTEFQCARRMTASMEVLMEVAAQPKIRFR